VALAQRLLARDQHWGLQVPCPIARLVGDRCPRRRSIRPETEGRLIERAQWELSLIPLPGEQGSRLTPSVIECLVGRVVASGVRRSEAGLTVALMVLVA
jgi:hypothetical protein